MSTIQILVIGRHPEIMETILRLINNKPGWEGTAALTNEEAISAFQEKEFDIVLLGAGIPPAETEHLRQFFNTHKPNIPVIQHYGGGSGLLYAEVLQAVNKQNKGEV